MNIETVIQSLTSLGAVLAAILAWIAKLQWSKEFSKAKEATIRAKEAQIRILENSLEEFKKIKEAQIKTKEEEIKILKSSHQTLINIKDQEINIKNQEMENILAIASPKLQEYIEFTKVQLELQNDKLNLRVKELEEAMNDKNKLIKSYKDNELNHLEEIEELEKQRIKLDNKLSETINEKEELQNTLESVEIISEANPNKDINTPLVSSKYLDEAAKYINTSMAIAAIESINSDAAVSESAKNLWKAVKDKLKNN